MSDLLKDRLKLANFICENLGNDGSKQIDLRQTMGQVKSHFAVIDDELRVFNEELAEIQKILGQISNKAQETGDRLKPFVDHSSPSAGNENTSETGPSGLEPT